MGYYTYRTLEMEMKDGSEVPETLVAQIRKSFNEIYDADADEEDYHFDEIYVNGDGGAEWKWYEDEEDMQKLAALYPDVHFILHGEGEEHSDLWIKDFLGDKMSVRYAEIIYPDLNWYDKMSEKYPETTFPDLNW